MNRIERLKLEIEPKVSKRKLFVSYDQKQTMDPKYQVNDWGKKRKGTNKTKTKNASMNILEMQKKKKSTVIIFGSLRPELRSKDLLLNNLEEINFFSGL